MKKEIAYVVIFFLIILHLYTQQMNDTIRVGIYDNFPKVYLSDHKKVAGIFPEILEIIAEKENWNLEYMYGNWNECLQRLENAEIDIMVDVAFSETRKQKYNFTEESVLISWGCVYTNSRLKLNSILDLQNKKIAVMQNSILTTGEEGIYNMVKRYGVSCKFIEVKDYYEVFSLIQKEEVDAGVTNRQFGAAFHEKYDVKKSNIVFYPTQLKYAFPKNAPKTASLIKEIDKNLVDMQSDMSSEYYSILTKYKLFPKEKLPSWIIPLTSTLATLTIIFFIIYLLMKWRIKKQTILLQKTNENLKKEIEKHKKTYDELLLSREFYRNFVENIPGLVYIYDMDPAGERFPVIPTVRSKELLGEELGETVNKDYNKFFDYIVEEDREELMRLSKEIEKNNNAYIFEYRLKLNDDTIKWFRSFGRVKKLENGNTRWQGVILDINDQKEAENALSLAVMQWQSTFDATKDAIWILDMDQKILQVNKSAVKLFKKEKNELIGNYCYEVVHQTKTNIPECPFIRIMKSRKRESMELNYENDIWFNVTVDPIFDQEDHMIGGVHIIRDISERKKNEQKLKIYQNHLKDMVEIKTRDLQLKTQELKSANQRLLEADKLKSIFLASMSHELRTPLNSIIGFTGILLMGMVGELTDEQKHQISIVKQSANHLLELINDVLDISKIEAGKVDISKENFNLSTLLDEIILSLQPHVEKKNLTIHKEYDDNINIYSDRRRIKQIIINLMSNAVKFTDKGEISLIARIESNANLKIVVQDTGTGIDDEGLKKLFEPFQQLEPNLTKKQEGTGLGLHLTQKLVSLLGGKITVASKKNIGSTFTVVLSQIQKEK